jgi:hypothetical protein
MPLASLPDRYPDESVEMKARVTRMAVKLMNKPIFAACIALVVLTAAGQTRWRLPVTIEALQNVLVQAPQTSTQVRGVLHIVGAESFTIKKGQRFLMVRIYTEGECRIQFEKKEYDVSSCPWMDGFTDHQADVFKVVSGDSGRKKTP